MFHNCKFLIIFLFLVFSTFSHAFILTPTSKEFLQPVSDNSGIRFGLNPAFFFSNYQDEIVSPKDSTGYVLVNPAENIFYLHDILPPLGEVKLDYKASNFGLYVNFEHKYSIESGLIKLGKFTNIPLNLTEYLTNDLPRAYDTTTPHEAFVYCFNDDIFLAVGRFKIKWGDARYPVHISDTTFQDNFTFLADVDDFRFTFHYISIIPWLTYEELYIQSNYSRGSDTRKIYSEPYKTIVAHRLDWFAGSPVFSGRIGISETNLIGGKKPDLIDISPVMFLHNTWGENYSNVTWGADFSLLFGSRLKFYGELVFDNLQWFTEIGDTVNQEAYAWNFGTEFIHKTGEYELKLWTEYAFSSEWMYISVGLPYLTINTRQYRLDQYTGKAFLADYPLGFKYGPDAKMFSSGLDLSVLPLNLNISAEYNYLLKGLVNDGGIIRWKWFWDRWTGNVSGLVREFEDVEDRAYHIFKIDIDWANRGALFRWVVSENEVLYFFTFFWKVLF